MYHTNKRISIENRRYKVGIIELYVGSYARMKQCIHYTYRYMYESIDVSGNSFLNLNKLNDYYHSNIYDLYIVNN